MHGQAGVLQKEDWILVNGGVRAFPGHPCPIKQRQTSAATLTWIIHWRNWPWTRRNSNVQPDKTRAPPLHQWPVPSTFSSEPIGPFIPGHPNPVHSLPSHLECGVNPHSMHRVNPIHGLAIWVHLAGRQTHVSTETKSQSSIGLLTLLRALPQLIFNFWNSTPWMR